MLHVCIHHSSDQRVEPQSEGNGTKRVGQHQVSIVKCAVLPTFIFIGKLLRDLQLLIWGPLQMNNLLPQPAQFDSSGNISALY